MAIPTDFMRSRWLAAHYPELKYPPEEQRLIVESCIDRLELSPERAEKWRQQVHDGTRVYVKRSKVDQALIDDKRIVDKRDVDDHDWTPNGKPDLDYGENGRDFAIARAEDGYWALTHEAAELVHDAIMGDDD